MQIVQSAPRQSNAAKIARVSVSDADCLGAVAMNESRGMSVIAPGGVAYIPREGDSVLLQPVGGAQVCAGVLCDTQGLAPGEVRLRSAGGAVIALKNNGEIELNGLVITAQGQIRTP